MKDRIKRADGQKAVAEREIRGLMSEVLHADPDREEPKFDKARILEGLGEMLKRLCLPK